MNTTPHSVGAAQNTISLEGVRAPIKPGGTSKTRWVVPTLYIVFLLLPIYWLVNMSFKTNQEILSMFTLWPEEPTLRNYAVIFSDPSWYRGYFNSMALSLIHI